MPRATSEISWTLLARLAHDMPSATTITIETPVPHKVRLSAISSPDQHACHIHHDKACSETCHHGRLQDQLPDWSALGHLTEDTQAHLADRSDAACQEQYRPDRVVREATQPGAT